MITRLWSLTLLVAQLALGLDYSIDLTRCESETTCLIRESCIKDKIDAANLVEYKNQPLVIDNHCDAVLQIRPLGFKIMHVMMQFEVKPDEKLMKDEGVKLEQGGTQFHCKPGSITKRAGITIVMKGEPYYSEKRIFCSFTVEADIGTFNQASLDKPKIVVMKDNGNDEVMFSKVGDIMWRLIIVECDHALVSSSDKDGTDTNYVLKEIDTTRNPLICTNQLLIGTSDATLEKASKVFCKDRKWMKEIEAPVEITGSFKVYCQEKTCLQCKSGAPPLDCKDCTATKYTASTDASSCPTFKCETAESKFTVNGEAPLDGDTAECKRSLVDVKKHAWFVGDEELTKAACMLKKIDCGAKYRIGVAGSYPVYLDLLANAVVGLGTNTLSCEKDNYYIDIALADVDNDTNLKKLECNVRTGFFQLNGKDLKNLSVICQDPNAAANTGLASAGFKDIVIPLAIAGGTTLFVIIILAGYCIWSRSMRKKRRRATTASSKKQLSAKKTAEKITNKSTSSAASAFSAAPGDVDVSQGKKKSSKRDSKRSKRDKKLKLDDHQTWDNETFTKKILPNFKMCDAEAKQRWLRDTLCRFYAYSNTKKAPESGTFNQFWLLVKQCADDKCEDPGVWVELFNICFLIGYSIADNNEHTNSLRGHYMKPLENYMLEYLKKCDFYKRKDEPRSETEMRVICIEVLLHTRHPDVTETLRKLTYNEKLEVPLRMLTAACYTRERDDKGKTVQEQYKRVIDTSVLDPHAAEGWGTYLQHCAFGLGGYLITLTETFQFQFFDALYQFPLQKDPTADRVFTPSDWLYAYKGALLHENSAKIGLDIFKKMNSGCLLHIDTLLKQKHKDDVEEMEKHREQYKKDMKEYTQLLSELLIGEEEFNDFKSHLHFVLLFIDDHAKSGEPLSEDRIRERAINMQNMLRDRNFAKECVESLKAIGAKDI